MLIRERGENDAICIDLQRISRSLQASSVASVATRRSDTQASSKASQRTPSEESWHSAQSSGRRSPPRGLDDSGDELGFRQLKITRCRTPKYEPRAPSAKGFGLAVEVMKVTLIRDRMVLRRHPVVVLRLGNESREVGVLQPVKNKSGEYASPERTAISCWPACQCTSSTLMVQVFSREHRLAQTKMKPLGMGSFDLRELENDELDVNRIGIPLEGPRVEPGSELVVSMWKQALEEAAEHRQ